MARTQTLHARTRARTCLSPFQPTDFLLVTWCILPQRVVEEVTMQEQPLGKRLSTKTFMHVKASSCHLILRGKLHPFQVLRLGFIRNLRATELCPLCKVRLGCQQASRLFTPCSWLFRRVDFVLLTRTSRQRRIGRSSTAQPVL